MGVIQDTKLIEINYENFRYDKLQKRRDKELVL